MGHEERLQQLELELPPASKSIGVYKLVLVSNGMAYLSGHGPVGADGTGTVGRLGDTMQKEEGYEAARRTGLRRRFHAGPVLTALFGGRSRARESIRVLT